MKEEKNTHEQNKKDEGTGDGTTEASTKEEKKNKLIEERKAKAHARYMRYFRSIRSARLNDQ